MNESKATYHITLHCQDESHAQAIARDHILTLNIKKGSGQAGFNAVETVMAALGACLLTNVQALSDKMRLQIENAQVEIFAERKDEPPALTQLSYRLILKSNEPQEKLEQLHELCLKWGTVTNTLINGVPIEGKLIIQE